MAMFADLAFYLVAILILLVIIASAIKILREYERGVVFTLGRFTGVKGPGLIPVSYTHLTLPTIYSV